ncbi:MAG: DUF962 domain-containing protein [Elusimicrobia bacterium]|nr:DUF962 domain-containing protein [Elusimicrobiota bacterium]
MEAGFRTLDEFWPYYVSQHLNPTTRRLHFAGTTAGLACLAASLVWNNPFWVPIGLVCSYGLAWIGHYRYEKNRPATFAYPLFSLRADFRMYRLMWLGRMDAEIADLSELLKVYRRGRA